MESDHSNGQTVHCNGCTNEQPLPKKVSGYTLFGVAIDIEDEDEPCVSGTAHGCCCWDAGFKIPIHSYSQAPEYLHGNPYITDGYRGKLSFSGCIKSLFVWSNESINVWSHLIGFWIFFSLMLWDDMVVIPQHGGDLGLHLVYTTSMLCCQFTMLCSAGFHLFCCHSEQACMQWLTLDTSGISITILGMYISGTYITFYCFPTWRNVHLCFAGLLFAVVFYWQVRQLRHSSSGWLRARRLVYVALLSGGMLYAGHWIYLTGGFDKDIVQLFIPKLGITYLIGTASYCIYHFKIPESLFPGRFNYIGSSHQWWHILVVINCLYYYSIGRQMMSYHRYVVPCEAYQLELT